LESEQIELAVDVALQEKSRGPVEFQSLAIEVRRHSPTADFPHQLKRAGLSERFV
jgi:hypothetical protein